VIRVGKGADGQVPSDVPVHLFLIQKNTHEFRDGTRGMGVIKLDHGFVGKALEKSVIFFEAPSRCVRVLPAQNNVMMMKKHAELSADPARSSQVLHSRLSHLVRLSQNVAAYINTTI
jgi:hypothetical protein